MEPSSKEEILPLKEATKKYFLKTLELCGGNRTETAKILKLNPRTVRTYCKEFGVPSLESKPKTEAIPKLSEEEFECIRPVTPKERDEWYNKDRF